MGHSLRMKKAVLPFRPSSQSLEARAARLAPVVRIPRSRCPRLAVLNAVAGGLRFAAAVLLLMSAAPSRAEKAAAASASPGVTNTTTLPEVVVRGDKEADPTAARIARVRENYPGSVATMSPRDLAIQKANNLGEVLARIPGAAYVDEDGRGTKPDVSLRGLNPIRSEYVQMLHDGVPTQPSMYSEQAAYYGVPAERVAAIEVFKGGSSILFGPNTVGGVINLISRAPSAYPWELILDSRFDTYGDYLGNMAVSGTEGKLSYAVEYMHKGGDGFRNSLGYSIDDVDTKLIYRPNEDHSVQIHFHYDDERSETPGGLLPSQFRSNRTISSKPNDVFFGERIEGDVRTHHQLTDQQALDLLFYAYSYQRDWYLQNFVSNTTPNMALANSNGQFLRNFETVGFEPKYTLTYDAAGMTDHQLRIGSRFYHDDVNRRSFTGRTGTAWNDNAVRTAEDQLDSFVAAAYVENEFKLTPELSLTPGGRYEYIAQSRTDLFAGTAEQSKDYDVWIPGLGASYRLAPKTLAYLNVSRAFRPPTFGDSFNPAIGASSLDLKPSTAWTYEGGIRAEPYAWLQADLGGYYTEFSDQVVVSGGTAANYDTESYGFEGVAQIGLVGLSQTILEDNPYQTPDHEIFLQAGASLIESVFANGAFQDRTLPYVANDTYTFGLLYDYRNLLNVGFQGRYVGKRFSDNANTVPENNIATVGELDAYTVFDLKFRWQVTELLTISAGINNLFDETYATQRRTGQQKGVYPGPTRVFYLATTLKFH